MSNAKTLEVFLIKLDTRGYLIVPPLFDIILEVPANATGLN